MTDPREGLGLLPQLYSYSTPNWWFKQMLSCSRWSWAAVRHMEPTIILTTLMKSISAIVLFNRRKYLRNWIRNHFYWNTLHFWVEIKRRRSLCFEGFRRHVLMVQIPFYSAVLHSVFKSYYNHTCLRPWTHNKLQEIFRDSIETRITFNCAFFDRLILWISDCLHEFSWWLSILWISSTQFSSIRYDTTSWTKKNVKIKLQSSKLRALFWDLLVQSRKFRVS